MMDTKAQDIALELKQRIEKYTSIQEYRVSSSRTEAVKTRESDLNIFIKLERVNPAIRQKSSECTREVGFSNDVVFSTFIAEREQIDERKAGAPEGWGKSKRAIKTRIKRIIPKIFCRLKPSITAIARECNLELIKLNSNIKLGRNVCVAVILKLRQDMEEA